MTPAALFWLTLGPALAAAVCALVTDGLGTRASSNGTVASALLLGAGGLVGLVGGQFNVAAGVFGTFRVGQGYSTVAGLVLMLSAAALVGSLGSRFSRGGQGAALVSLSALGSALAATSTDLLVTVLSLETAAVSGYALVALGRSRRAHESALKYFIQGAVASGLLVMGVVALAAGGSGDLSYTLPTALATSLGTSLPVLAAVLLIVTAFTFKVGSVPFHSWAPDAYENAPASAAAVLSGPVKLAAVTVLAGFVLALSKQGETAFAQTSSVSDVAVVLAVLAAASVLVGSLTALSQTSYRRMLGYAGVAQAGYGLMAIAAFNASAAVFHLSMYAVASVAVFVAASAFETLRPGWDGSIAGLAGLGRRHPVLGGAVTVALASLAGLPPMAGFWGKLQVFIAPVTAALSASGQGVGWAGWMYVLLALAGVIGSVVSLAYYGAVVRQLFFAEEPQAVARDTLDGGRSSALTTTTSGEGTTSEPASGPPVVTVVLCGLVVLVAGLAPLVTGITPAFAGFLLTR